MFFWGGKRILAFLGVTEAVSAPVPDPGDFMDDLEGLDVARWGSPFVQGPVNRTVVLTTLDYAQWGSPYAVWGNVS